MQMLGLAGTQLQTWALQGQLALNALALFGDDKVPNEDALKVAPTVGWLLLAFATVAAIMFILNSEGWRRFWLAAEDPRAIGLYRIVFGIFVICNMNDIWEYFEFLFTDEGIFTADVARQVHASAQFVGFGDGLSDDSPWGFFDWYGFWEFLKGPKYSLLYIWDSPKAFWIHLWAFEISAFLFVIGFRTRFFGVLTFFLMNSIFFRNHLFWEGTELVYRVFLAYLICAKAGHAYSVDNWLRCRKLRRKGLLSEPGGPGDGRGVAPSDEHPKGLQAIYRLIPAWPRRLAILQLGVVYACTGILKNGGVWAKGDAVYYAWNMDHFYRFYPQRIAALIGTNFLRIASWQAHWGEALFAICIFGVIVHWAAREKLPPLTGWRRTGTHLCWLTLFGLSAAIIGVTWHVHFTPAMPLQQWIPAQYTFLTLWVGGLLAIWVLWLRLGRKPFEVRGRRGLWILWGVAIAVGNLLLWLLMFPLVPRQAFIPQKLGIMAAVTAGAIALPLLVKKFLPQVVTKLQKLPIFTAEFLDNKHTIDRQWVASWIVGRRIWLTWHIALMGGIFTLMNIGQFQTGMLSQTFVFLTGAEAAIIVHFVLKRLKLTKLDKPIGAEDRTLPHLHRDSALIPQWALFVALGVFLLGIFVKVDLMTKPDERWFLGPEVAKDFEWRWIWVAAMAFLAGVATWRWRASRGEELPLRDSEDAPPRAPWAYGPFGRFVIGSLIIWQIVAVATWLLPDKDSVKSFRNDARHVFTKWLTLTQTDQGWGMFAPNPPRTNVFLKVLVYDENGEVYDLKTDVYAPERKPIPWIWNDRMRKMNRRIIGGESGNTQWYRKWYARWICRDWAQNHEGIEPEKVELVKIWYKMPSPEEVLRKGWYVPEDLLERTGHEKVEHTEHCQRTVMGQLPPWVRERHDLPPLREGWKYRPWLKHKKKKWDKRREQEEGKEPDKAKAQAARAKPVPAKKN
jgi:hypothetical protein